MRTSATHAHTQDLRVQGRRFIQGDDGDMDSVLMREYVMNDDVRRSYTSPSPLSECLLERLPLVVGESFDDHLVVARQRSRA